MQLDFTVDWASRHFPVWAKWLAPFKNRPASALEIGSYEGRSAIWFLQNILNHPKSRLICIDRWRDADVHRRFLKNISASNVVARCEVHKGETNSRMRNLHTRFDFAYVDADHRAHALLSDAVMTWPLLNARGVLILDDYLWQDPEGKTMPPKVGIDAFLKVFVGQYELLHKSWQVIIRKL
jgi:predicted O-methyltransferase YrrM